jgi:hypothetical protein
VFRDAVVIGEPVRVIHFDFDAATCRRADGSEYWLIGGNKEKRDVALIEWVAPGCQD